jgi:pimeloyl-ACP methyl ester carboxylesterase
MMKAGQFYLLQGCGHMAMVECPAEAARQINGFIEDSGG